MKKTLFLLSTFVLAACSDGNEAPSSQETAPAQTATSAPTPSAGGKTYRVLSEHNYVPFIMYGKGNEVSGFDYDILQAIAQKQGLTLTFTAHPWNDLLPAVARGDGDIATSGLSITDERQKSVDFTDAHFETETALLTKDSKIQQFADMAGKKISIQSDTTQGDVLAQYQKGTGEVSRSDKAWSTINEVLKDKSDGALGDLLVMQYYVKQYPDQKLRVVREPKVPREQLAFAVKKDNAELKNKLNQGLKQIKEDGTYQKIHEKWFGKAS